MANMAQHENTTPDQSAGGHEVDTTISPPHSTEQARSPSPHSFREARDERVTTSLAEPAESSRASTSTNKPLPRPTRQQTGLSTRSWRQPPVFDPQLQHAQTMEDKLTFFERHFTKPVDSDPEKRYSTSNRRFAFLSHGFLIMATFLLFILLGVIGAAVGVTLDHQHRKAATTISGGAGGSGHGGSGSGGDGSPGGRLHSPIRAALFDNFPDPTLLLVNGTWYAYATNNAAGILQRPDNVSSYEYGASNVQVATSDNFVNWTLLASKHDPLPETGMWVAQGNNPHTTPPIPRANVWAPSVIQRPGDNKFLLYYTAARNKLLDPSAQDPGNGRDDDDTGADDANNKDGSLADDANEAAFIPRHPAPHCIGASVSRTDSPLGPFDPVNTTFACPIEQGGAIDPAAFVDHDNKLYVLYKVDGNNVGNGGVCGNTVEPIVPTPIMLQRMHEDGLIADGDAVQLLDRTKDDGPLIEAPELVRSHEGIYFLFFSSGCTRTPSYDIKYATSTNLTGPYTRAQYTLLETDDWGLLAPGSAGVTADGAGNWNMAFHARVTMEQGRIRALFTAKLRLEGHVAKLVQDD